MRHKFLPALVAAFALFGGLGATCPPPPDENPGVIDCTIDAVRKHGPGLVPEVNACLTRTIGVQDCLIGLLDNAADITQTVLACVVRAAQSEYAASAAANPEDGISARAAANATAFIEEQGYQFRE